MSPGKTKWIYANKAFVLQALCVADGAFSKNKSDVATQGADDDTSLWMDAVLLCRFGPVGAEGNDPM